MTISTATTILLLLQMITTSCSAWTTPHGSVITRTRTRPNTGWSWEHRQWTGGRRRQHQRQHSCSILGVGSTAVDVPPMTMMMATYTYTSLTTPPPTTMATVSSTTTSTASATIASRTTTFSTLCLSSDNDGPMIMDVDTLVSPLIVVGVAILLLIAAQTFINQMLEGDEGLGAYLRDGSGYNKSGFRSSRNNKFSSTTSTETTTTNDPLPWLKLPQFDFVEVAGQEPKQQQLSNDVYETLEGLRIKMNEQLEIGNIQEATVLRQQLEDLMKNNNIDYQAD